MLLLRVHSFFSTDENSNHGKKHDGQKLVEAYECAANEKTKKKNDAKKRFTQIAFIMHNYTHIARADCKTRHNTRWQHTPRIDKNI